MIDCICITPNVKYGECGHYIPRIHAIKIKKRLESGKNYIEASPFYMITREEAALLLTISWKDLQRNKDLLYPYRRF